MEIKAYNQMKKTLEEHKQMCEEYDQRRAAARKELEDVKAEKQTLLNRQIEGDDVIKELSIARTKVEVAEEKYNRLIKEIGETNPELNLKDSGVSLIAVRSEISTSIGTGELLEENMKDEMEALSIAREQYLQAAEQALIKWHDIRSYLRDIEIEAAALSGENRGAPVDFPLYKLRPALWITPNDYGNDFNKVSRKVDTILNGPPREYGMRDGDKKVVIPSKKPDQVEYGTTNL